MRQNKIGNNRTQTAGERKIDMKTTYITYKVICPYPSKLYRLFRENSIEASFSGGGEIMEITFGVFRKKLVCGIFDRLGCQYELIKKGLLCRISDTVKKRAGLAVGAAVCAAAIMILKNFVVSIEILSDDEQIKADVMTILSDSGVRPMTYIPSVNCVSVERALKQKVDGISWAGISITDSTLIIDVIENTESPDMNSGHTPSDLVATHDAVIEDIELYNGQLVKTIGSAVLRGETIVSGKVITEKTEWIDGEEKTEESEKYVRSVGTVYGTYTDVQTFEQSYKDVRLIETGEELSKNYLSVFGVDIPLFLKDSDGLYISEESSFPLEILGEETPISLKKVSLSGYSFETVVYSKEQAEKRAYELKETYEENFLGDCEILSEDSEISYEDGGAVLTVTYEIYGVISEESQFFIKK